MRFKKILLGVLSTLLLVSINPAMGHAVVAPGSNALTSGSNALTPSSSSVAGGQSVSGAMPANAQFQEVTAGVWFTLGLDDNGDVFSWGYNTNHQLGLGLNQRPLGQMFPNRVVMPHGEKIQSIVAGSDHSLALTTDGDVLVWGMNSEGQLGLGHRDSLAIPTKVIIPTDYKIVDIAAGSNFSVALDSSGQAYSWGYNKTGELGNGSIVHSDVPVPLTMPTGVKFTSVSAGATAGYAIGNDGNSYAWGENIRGTLGTGTVINSLAPTRIRLPEGTRLQAIEAGRNFALGLTETGMIFSWGDNADGRLGRGYTSPHETMPGLIAAPAGTTFTRIAAGTTFALAVTSGNDGYSWGYNVSGQLGDGTGASRSVPNRIDGDFISLTGGTVSTTGITPDHKVVSWGGGYFGQLGQGFRNSSLTPVNLALMPVSVSRVTFGGVDGTYLSTTPETWHVTAPAGCGVVDVEVFYTVTGDARSQIMPAAFTFGAAPVITRQPVSSVVDAETEFELNVQFSADPTPAVQWQVRAAEDTSWVDIANATSATLVGIASSTAEYRAVLTNCVGAVTSAPATVTVPEIAEMRYDANGGSGKHAPVTAVVGDEVVVHANAFVRAGYTFAGWNTAADGTGTAVQAGEPFVLNTSDNVLYAQWSANEVQLSYHANGGLGSLAPTLGVTDGNVTVTDNAFTRPGYTFSGWNTAADGSGHAHATGASYALGTEAVNLYAQWAANAVEIVYEANGGTGAQAATTGIVDAAAQLSPNTFVREGYTFTGWNTAVDGSGVAAQPTETIVLGASGVTMFAQWSPNPVELTYHANGGSGSVESTQGVVDGSVTLAENTFVRTGYTFAGWNTVALGGGLSGQSGESFTLAPSGNTVYAQWVANASSVSYQANGGVGTTADTAGEFDGSVDLSHSFFERQGYTFTGWNTNADGSGVTYAPGGSFALTSVAPVLYAQWAANASEVAYNANGGSGTMAAATGVVDANVVLAQATFVREGYTFVEWNTAADGSGEGYKSADTYTLGSSVAVLYAQWAADEAQISYDANGGSGTTAPTVGVTDGTVTLAENSFARDGYTFTGWNTAADGSGVPRNAGEDFVFGSADAQLYAQWQANETLMSYHANGAAGEILPTAGFVDSEITIPKNSFVYDGYLFIGWNTASDGTGSVYAPGQTFRLAIDGNELYAQWEQDPDALAAENDNSVAGDAGAAGNQQTDPNIDPESDPEAAAVDTGVPIASARIEQLNEVKMTTATETESATAASNQQLSSTGAPRVWAPLGAAITLLLLGWGTVFAARRTGRKNSTR